jgi:hypothetical protein
MSCRNRHLGLRLRLFAVRQFAMIHLIHCRSPAKADTRRMAETATKIGGSGRSPSGAVRAAHSPEHSPE